MRVVARGEKVATRTGTTPTLRSKTMTTRDRSEVKGALKLETATVRTLTASRSRVEKKKITILLVKTDRDATDVMTMRPTRIVPCVITMISEMTVQTTALKMT